MIQSVRMIGTHMEHPHVCSYLSNSYWYYGKLLACMHNGIVSLKLQFSGEQTKRLQSTTCKKRTNDVLTKLRNH